ncbi:hypothetical protein CRENBAI_004473 [Crenichthys baileyi]|uniref:Fibrinogen C-terminal domain-containing protein n=1 Tax=Crenichthys baileyi TaxID=28760 RepID=A0AAV9S866_9TELE
MLIGRPGDAQKSHWKVEAMKVTFLLAQLLLAVSVQSNSQAYLPIDCDDIYQHDSKSSSGVYTIYPGGPTTPLHVYCDMETDGGRLCSCGGLMGLKASLGPGNTIRLALGM